MGPFRTEYARQFKDSPSSAHAQNYRERFDYRTYRRQLEHHHQFVTWDWDSDSDCSEKNSSNRNNINNNADVGRDYRIVRPTQEEDLQQKGVESNHKLEKDNESGHGNHDDRLAKGSSDKASLPKRRRSHTSKKRNRHSSSPGNHQQSPPGQPSKKASPSKPGPAHSPKESSKKPPPFLAFGWANKEKSIGEKKTHNVLASTDVYSSALRCLKRNEYAIHERQAAFQRECLSQKRFRALFNSTPAEEDVWMTEYQRNFSARPPTR